MLVLQQWFLYLEQRGELERDLFKTATFAALFLESVMKGASATVSLSFSSPHSGSWLSHSPPSLTTSWCVGNHGITICNQKKKKKKCFWSPEELILLLTQDRLIQPRLGLNGLDRVL